MIVKIKYLNGSNIYRIYHKNANGRWTTYTGQAFYSLREAKAYCKENKLTEVEQ